MPGARVVRVLERLESTIGRPQVLVSDDGPEFAGRRLDAWAYQRSVKLRFIRAGQAARERVHRELQPEVSRRVPQQALVPEHRRGRQAIGASLAGEHR